MTMILRCNCKHPEQDRLHGAQMRAHNFARNENGKAGGYRCTVCLNVKPLSKDQQQAQEQ